MQVVRVSFSEEVFKPRFKGQDQRWTQQGGTRDIMESPEVKKTLMYSRESKR